MSPSQTAAAPAAHAEPTSFIRKYVWSYDHKTIGKQYIWTSLAFMILGGLLAMLIRWQIAYPFRPLPWIGRFLAGHFVFGADGAVSPDGYLVLASLHGLVMVFFVVIPLIVGGFGNFLVPLQIGARDVAFPFLNALSYWLYLPSGLLLFVAMFLDKNTATAGWTNYPPLSALTSASHSGVGMDLVILAVYFTGFSSILGGVNFITTVVRMRAPGMTYNRLSLVTWAQIITAVFQAFATPMLAAAGAILLSDRMLGSSFFIPQSLQVNAQPVANAGGGYPLLWQHVFWFYAHPAVYILILPAMGFASEIISTFSRKPVFGYKAMVISMVVIMGLGFLVWGHHMFVSGMNPVLGYAFMVSTLFIALPSGIKVFNWLATVWRGSIRLKSPMLFALSFVWMFVTGGLTGLFMAATPVDIYVHDTYYVISHFHFIVFGGTIFTVFGGLIFWYPKMFGRMMDEGLAKLHWALTFIFFNLVFFPMYFVGEADHMRRLADSTGYRFLNSMAPMNEFISISAFCLGVSQILFLVNFVFSLRYGRKAPANPWEANGLEWTIPSPAPSYNYAKIPTVYRWPYEYSTPEAGERGYLTQSDPGPEAKH